MLFIYLFIKYSLITIH